VAIDSLFKSSRISAVDDEHKKPCFHNRTWLVSLGLSVAIVWCSLTPEVEVLVP
jgi:hypothetical protein